MSLCRQNLPKIPNPVNICQQVYGIQNVNDVRDCIMDSIRRFYGFMCGFHEKNLYYIIQTYLIKVLEDAGRNPKAVKLAISPGRIQADFFVKRYIESNFDKQKAYNMCIQDCQNFSKSRGNLESCQLNCKIDSNSI